MKLTDAEWQVMNALWDGHPATAKQISGRLPRKVNWAYTTLKTMLNRLVDKGVLRERKEGIASVYEPILTREKARRGALRNLANQAFDGAFGPLMHFLVDDQRMSAKQRQELIRILEEGLKGDQK